MAAARVLQTCHQNSCPATCVHCLVRLPPLPLLLLVLLPLYVLLPPRPVLLHLPLLLPVLLLLLPVLLLLLGGAVPLVPRPACAPPLRAHAA